MSRCCKCKIKCCEYWNYYSIDHNYCIMPKVTITSKTSFFITKLSLLFAVSLFNSFAYERKKNFRMWKKMFKRKRNENSTSQNKAYCLTMGILQQGPKSLLLDNENTILDVRIVFNVKWMMHPVEFQIKIFGCIATCIWDHVRWFSVL